MDIICLYISPGKYTSNSTIEPFEHEQEDINQVIDWMIKQPWSNGKVGMIGGSYLGLSQWADTKKLHPALKTIIPQVSVGIGTVDFPMNNKIFTSYGLFDDNQGGKGHWTLIFIGCFQTNSVRTF